MDPRPRPPPPPIPANIGTATGSSAPAAPLVTESPISGSTGQGVIHFMKTILKDFSSSLWRTFYVNTWDVKDSVLDSDIGLGTPATCSVSDLKASHPDVQTIMFNPYCFGKPMLWHNEDVTPNYKPLVAWSGKVQKEVFNKFSEREDADRIALANIKNFLSVRPLRRDMDRWIAY